MMNAQCMSAFFVKTKACKKTKTREMPSQMKKQMSAILIKFRIILMNAYSVITQMRIKTTFIIRAKIFFLTKIITERMTRIRM